MISSVGTPLNLDTLGESLAAALAQGEGAGFLESLMGALPPELKGMSAEELLEWLQSQDQLVLPFAPMPAQLPPAEVAADRVPQDPAALLSLLMSSRGELPPGLSPDAAAAGGAGALADTALFAQQTDAGGDSPPPFQNLLQAAGSLGAAHSARPGSPSEIPSFSLGTPVTDAGFGQALGERLVWMLRQGVQQAKIHLDPAHLGPLEIAVSIKDDVASVVIHAHHITTRDVLDADSQRLRSMLGDSGFTSVDVNVARDSGRQAGDGQPGRAPAGLFGLELEPGGAEVEAPAGVSLRGRGLVDHYA